VYKNLKKIFNKLSPFAQNVWIIVATTVVYFCMYMFRKAFLAAKFEGISFYGIDYKSLLVISQILGYALSKFIGISIISSLKENQRILYLLILITVSWVALLGFTLLPSAYGPVCFFINGIPLGMIWGIVFSFIEGRRLTEVFTVFLASNFMLSSGVAKTLGLLCINYGFSSFQMPFIVGAITFPILLLTIGMLSVISPPSTEDISIRKVRVPMTKQDRSRFFEEEKWFIICIVIIYIVLTCIRDIRDSFAVEIWSALGYNGSALIYTSSETYATLLTLLVLALFYFINSHIKAINVMTISCLVFIVLMILSNSVIHLNPLYFMISNGIALFIPYILFNGILFDRYIAAFSIKGNVGFIMYIADSFGYLSSVGVMIYKVLNPRFDNWLVFYQKIAFYGAILIAFFLLFLLVNIQFKAKSSMKFETH
jgi:hypothetical protein